MINISYFILLQDNESVDVFLNVDKVVAMYIEKGEDGSLHLSYDTPVGTYSEKVESMLDGQRKINMIVSGLI